MTSSVQRSSLQPSEKTQKFWLLAGFFQVVVALPALVVVFVRFTPEAVHRLLVCLPLRITGKPLGFGALFHQGTAAILRCRTALTLKECGRGVLAFGTGEDRAVFVQGSIATPGPKSRSLRDQQAGVSFVPPDPDQSPAAWPAAGWRHRGYRPCCGFC